MKVLLDENLPHALRKQLTQHEAVSATRAGSGAFKNGALLRAAENAGFDVLVTGDQTLQFEQNMHGRKLALVCLSAISWKILKNQIQRIVEAVDAARPGAVVLVGCGRFVRPKKSPG